MATVLSRFMKAYLHSNNSFIITANIMTKFAQENLQRSQKVRSYQHQVCPEAQFPVPVWKIKLLIKHADLMTEASYMKQKKLEVFAVEEVKTDIKTERSWIMIFLSSNQDNGRRRTKTWSNGKTGRFRLQTFWEIAILSERFQLGSMHFNFRSPRDHRPKYFMAQ